MTKRNRKENGVHLPFLEQEFVDKWQEWLQYRKERRLAAYVPTGLKQTFTKLIKDSGSDYRIAIQIIDQSLGNGWQGLFPLKVATDGTTNYPTNSGSHKGVTGTSANRIRAAKDF